MTGFYDCLQYRGTAWMDEYSAIFWRMVLQSQVDPCGGSLISRWRLNDVLLLCDAYFLFCVTLFAPPGYFLRIYDSSVVPIRCSMSYLGDFLHFWSAMRLAKIGFSLWIMRKTLISNIQPTSHSCDTKARLCSKVLNSRCIGATMPFVKAPLGFQELIQIAW